MIENGWDLTPKQYYIQRIKQMSKDSGLTQTECREFYTYDVIEQEYYQQFDKWIHEDIRVPDRVLDRLTDRARYRALHDYSDRYKGYMPPAIRKTNRETKIG